MSFGLLLIVVATAACACPPAALAHEGALHTVQGHINEDSVVHTPAKEARLEGETEEITESDAAAAAAATADNAGQVGEWGPLMSWPVVGVHVALLENGKVLAYDSVGDLATERYSDHTFTRATVWDPATGAHIAANVTTGVNIFCSGLAHLMDGSIFVAGGNKDAFLNGIKATHVFDEDTNTWLRGPDMSEERWYPSVTPLNDGEMLITEGYPDVPEVREVDGDLRRLTGASQDLALYPWIDVAPNGRAFVSGPETTMRSLNPSGVGSWQNNGQRDGVYRDYGSRALYDVGKILVSGGGRGDVTTRRSSRVIDLNGASPTTSATASMAYPRRQHNLTVLADGTVLATGGLSSAAALVDINNGVYNAELWNPSTGVWSTLAAEQVTRQYHSTALLLADGRVLSSGGGICGDCDSSGYLAKNAQVFSPPYLFDASGQPAARPVISSAPDVVSYGAPLAITTPNAAAIGKVAMVRLGAVTHSVNMEQRWIPLQFTEGTGALTATSPANANVAPPGVYMLFVIGDDGVPSVAKMVRIDPNTPPPPSAPTITDTDPNSPANDNNPEVKGTGAATGTTVRIYGDPTCTGPALGTGSAATFNGSAGISASVNGDQTTNLRATATNGSGTSACSALFAYTEDSTAPTAPSITDTDPDSPANDNNPEVKGTAAAGSSTVRLYSTADCSGAPLASGSTTQFGSPGITVAVPGNLTTNLRATAADLAGNVSACSSAFAYTEDSAAPATPAITDTDPDSPANDNNPEVKGAGEANSMIRIYGDSSCTGTVLASGGATQFGLTGITVPVPGDLTTNLRATATDAAGNASPCSTAFAYTEDSTAPAAPAITDTNPDSPANDNNPEVRGTAATGSTVRLYSTAGCSGTPLANGSSSEFSSTGLTVAVPGDQTTNLRATATDAVGNTSSCSTSFAYTEDSTAPSSPTINDTDPDSPANENNPEVRGTAAAGSTVKLYATADCSGTQLAGGGAAEFGATGLSVAVPGDQITNFRATATDAAGNASACSAPFAYTEDSTAPAAPAITDTDPDSPANDSSPEVKGTAAANSTVEIYAASDCTGAPLADGSAAQFGSPGITVTVADDQSTDLSATATDAAGNASVCSAPLTYVEDSTGPPPPTITATVPGSPANDNDPEVRGAGAATGSTVKIYGNAACDGTVLGSGTAAELNGSSGITVTVPDDSTTSLRATATDASDIPSACSNPFSYVEDSTAPRTSLADVVVAGSSATAIFDSEAGATFECKLDLGEFAACASPLVYDNLAEGSHTFAVRATDAAGNTEAPPAEDAFELNVEDEFTDVTPPETWIDDRPKRRGTKRKARFSFGSSEPGSSFECRLDREVEPCGRRLSITVPRGRHKLAVASTDAAGNTDATRATWTWIVERPRR